MVQTPRIFRLNAYHYIYHVRKKNAGVLSQSLRKKAPCQVTALY